MTESQLTCDRCLSHVSRHYDLPVDLPLRLKDFALLLRGQVRVQGQDVDFASDTSFDGIHRLPDLTHTRAEHKKRTSQTLFKLSRSLLCLGPLDNHPCAFSHQIVIQPVMLCDLFNSPKVALRERLVLEAISELFFALFRRLLATEATPGILVSIAAQPHDVFQVEVLNRERASRDAEARCTAKVVREEFLYSLN